MRKEKPENLRSTTLTITLPQSFDTLLKQSLDLAPSKILQEAVAEHVLGVSLLDLELEYAKPHSTPSKPESAHKAFIRAARWILESDIVGFAEETRNIHGDPICVWYIDVIWKLTDRRVLVRIDGDRPGFQHILYDKSIAVLDFKTTVDLIDAKKRWITSNLYLCQDEGDSFKRKIVRAWMKHSLVQIKG